MKTLNYASLVHLLVADKAAMGNCSDTVNVKSEPVGNITDLFRRDLDFTLADINVWFLYLTKVSLANLNELYDLSFVLLAKAEWHNDTNRMTCMTNFTLQNIWNGVRREAIFAEVDDEFEKSYNKLSCIKQLFLKVNGKIHISIVKS